MMDKDLVVTLNSDDPAYFGGYVNDNYRAVSDALSLKRDEIVAIVRNGFHASLMDASAKDAALAEVDRVLANHRVTRLVRTKPKNSDFTSAFGALRAWTDFRRATNL